jgi:hypothetical protein
MTLIQIPDNRVCKINVDSKNVEFGYNDSVREVRRTNKRDLLQLLCQGLTN